MFGIVTSSTQDMCAYFNLIKSMSWAPNPGTYPAFLARRGEQTDFFDSVL